MGIFLFLAVRDLVVSLILEGGVGELIPNWRVDEA